MFRHYLLTALRNFQRFRFSSIVNLTCLSFGVACMVVTYAVIAYVGGNDRHFAKFERIRIVATSLYSRGGRIRLDDMPYTGPAVARFLRADFPALEAVARSTNDWELPIAVNGHALFARLRFADPEFLSIFEFKATAGAVTATTFASNSAIITEEAAERIFGTLNVIGRTLKVEDQVDMTIVALIKAIPKPTRFDFEILAPMNVLGAFRPGERDAALSDSNIANWWYADHLRLTYLLLPANGSLTAAQLDAGLESFSARRVPDAAGELTLRYATTSLSREFLDWINSQFAGFTRTGIPLTTVAYVLAALVLGIACINYANLATALALSRGREVGLRKVLGARRSQLFVQHLWEALLLATVATALVLTLVILAAPLVRKAGFDLAGHVLWQPGFLGLVVALVLGVTLAGGAYPAVVFSSVRAIDALRGAAHGAGGKLAATLLVIVQFAASSFMLITALVMHSQNDVIRSSAAQLAAVPLVGINSALDASRIDYETLRSRLLSSPEIQKVTISERLAVNFLPTPVALSRTPDSTGSRIFASRQNISYDFFSTLGLRLLAGRDFSREFADDSIGKPGSVTGVSHVVIDEGLAAQLGWRKPQAAVGKSIYVPYGSGSNELRIVGVVERRPLGVIGMGATSNIYWLIPELAKFVTVRLSGRDTTSALSHIDAVWKELSPNVPIRRSFLDDEFNTSHRSLLQISGLIAALAVLGLGIAAVGLFGMAVHVTGCRMHEIGIRKTLGARTHQIVALLLRDFSRPVLVANLIAWPLAFLAMRVYLSLFVDRSALTPLPFVLGLVTTVGIAWLAVSKQTLQAASINPASVLRYE